MAKFLMLPFAIFVAITVVGCSKTENPINVTPVSQVPVPLRGSWRVASVTVDGVETPWKEALHRKGSTDAEFIDLNWNVEYDVVDFDSSGTTFFPEQGSVTVTEQQIAFTVQKVNGQVLSPYSQKSGQWAVHGGDTLTMSLDVGGKPWVMQCVHSDYYFLPSWDY